MRVEIVLPTAVGCTFVAYVIVYRVLSIESPTARWVLCVGVALGLFVLSLFAVTGTIRPFYAAFAVMLLYLVAQRMLTVRQPIKYNASYNNEDF